MKTTPWFGHAALLPTFITKTHHSPASTNRLPSSNLPISLRRCYYFLSPTSPSHNLPPTINFTTPHQPPPLLILPTPCGFDNISHQQPLHPTTFLQPPTLPPLCPIAPENTIELSNLNGNLCFATVLNVRANSATARNSSHSTHLSRLPPPHP